MHGPLVEHPAPAGGVEAAAARFPQFYSLSNTPGTLYYGFAVCEDSVFCREGYQDAAAMLKHLAAVKDIAAQPAGLKLNIVGPAAQLEKLRQHLEPAGAVFWQLDTGAFWM